jgi:hypothetical protein
MNRTRRFLSVVTLALVVFGAAVATATTVQKFSLQELTQKSSAIVMAKVEDTYSRREVQGGEIYTYITLRVLEPVKGMKGETSVTIRQIGGRVDNIESIVSGMPSFRKDEEVVLFLTARDVAGYPWVMGLEQGKYSVVTDEKGRKSVRNELSDELIRMAPDGRIDKGPSVSPELSLGSFLDRIKTDLNEAGKVQVDPTTTNE